MSLLLKLYSYIAPEELPVDVRQRRLFFFGVSLVAVPLLIVYSIRDYLTGNTAMAIINLSITTLILVGPAAFRKKVFDSWVYRVLFSMFLVVSLEGLAVGVKEEAQMLWIYILPVLVVFALGAKEGAIWCIISLGLATLFLINPSDVFSERHFPWTLIARFVVSYSLVSVTVILMDTIRLRYVERLKKETDAKLQAETKSMALQKRLLHDSKLQAMGTLAGGIAHQINNPLMSLSGSLELAEMQKNRPEAVSENLERAKRASKSIAGLVKKLTELTDISRFEDKAPVDITKCLNSALEVSSRKHQDKSIIVAKNGMDSSVFILGVEWEIVDAFRQIIDNAVSFTDEPNGEVHLEVRIATQGENVFIEVMDSGKGISHDSIQEVFDPFYTTKTLEGHVGLGLTQVHEAILHHSGEVEITSNPGEGTVVHFVLPLLTYEGLVEAPAELEA
jgi:signal transduction histidine kinase